MPKLYLPLLVSLALESLPSTALAQPVGPEFQVNTYTTSNQDSPSVASDANGNFVVVWKSDGQDGSSYGIFGQRYDRSGSPLGDEFQVNTYTTDEQSFPAVASDAAGNFVVVWDSNLQDGSSGGVFAQRYDSSGSPLGGEFQVSGNQGFPAVASDASGNFVVVWASNEDVFGQRYDSDGNPLGTEFQVNTYTEDGQGTPSIASDASGNFVVVWQSGYQDGSDDGIFGQRYESSGNPVGGEFQVNSYTTSGQYNPSVAMDASGNFVVVWTSRHDMGSSKGVFGRRFDSEGNALGHEFQVNTYEKGQQTGAKVASDPSGNFGIVWYSRFQDGDDSLGVFGQGYQSDGSRLGSEFHVNTYTPYNQFRPSVASDASGNLVVVWQSTNSQDGSSLGAFGQRFSPGCRRFSSWSAPSYCR